MQILNSATLSWALANGFEKNDALTAEGRSKIAAAFAAAHPSGDASKPRKERTARSYIVLAEGSDGSLTVLDRADDSAAARMLVVLAGVENPDFDGTYRLCVLGDSITPEEAGTETRGRKAKTSESSDVPATVE